MCDYILRVHAPRVFFVKIIGSMSAFRESRLKAHQIDVNQENDLTRVSPIYCRLSSFSKVPTLQLIYRICGTVACKATAQ